jgi:hypothetical protein
VSLPQPLQIRDWIRLNLHRGIDFIIDELTRVDELADSIGAPRPCSSVLVTDELSKHWKLEAPRGWSPVEIEQVWKHLSFRAAKIVSRRAEQDMKAVRRLQHVDAYLKKRADKGEALLEIESEMKEPNHAASPAA